MNTPTRNALQSLFDNYNNSSQTTVDQFVEAFNKLINGVINIQTKVANYVLALGDENSLIQMNLAGANTLTVPPNSSVAFGIGATIIITQIGAGATTITAGLGVTINSPAAAVLISPRYGAVTLIKVATNTWQLNGNLG